MSGNRNVLHLQFMHSIGEKEVCLPPCRAEMLAFVVQRAWFDCGHPGATSQELIVAG